MEISMRTTSRIINSDLRICAYRRTTGHTITIALKAKRLEKAISCNAGGDLKHIFFGLKQFYHQRNI